MKVQRMAAAGAIAAVVLGLWAAQAVAGTYTVNGCKLADGTPVGTQGWTPAEHRSWVNATDGCPGGALTVRLAPERDHEAYAAATWTFEAPAGTSIVGVRGSRRKVVAADVPNGVPTVMLRTDVGDLDACQRAFSPACAVEDGDVNLSLNQAGYVQLLATCVGGGSCPAAPSGEKALLEWRRIAVDLDDPNAASGQVTGGSLGDDAVESGVGALAFAATDAGGGVHRARLLVGGVVRAERELGDAKCRLPFRHPVPCPTTASGGIEIDTGQVPDGDHDVELEVVDAAGNVTAVLAPTARTFDNRPPVITGEPQVEGSGIAGEPLTCIDPPFSAQRPTTTYRWHRADVDGRNAAVAASAGGRQYTPGAADVGKVLRCELVVGDRGGTASALSPSRSGPFAGGATVRPVGSGQGAGGAVTVIGAGTSSGWTLDAFFTRRRSATTIAAWGSAVELGGRVKDGGGVPVKDAVVEVLIGERSLGATRSAADGGWAIKVLSRFASSRLTVRAKQPDGALRAAADLSLRVAAGIALRVTPGKVAPKGLIRFRGRLLGGPVPTKGKVLELRARSRGTKRWITFRTIRSDRRGAFRANYRLRRGFRNITYEFQVLSREEAAYPYAAGTSPVRAVRVR